ncbi:MAG: hypothetical protein IT350_10860 [Deltaproteobacteria bacterium]|nr:hypothetical protein [Deltaproteobacteria bacterium]
MAGFREHNPQLVEPNRRAATPTVKSKGNGAKSAPAVAKSEPPAPTPSGQTAEILG